MEAEDVEVVNTYKYLGLCVDTKLDTQYKKGQSRLHFLRRLQSFNICRKLLYSTIFYIVVWWRSSTAKKNSSWRPPCWLA